MSNRWSMTSWEDLFRELTTGEPAAYKEIGGGPRDFGPNYKQQELKYRLESTKPSIHTKDGQVLPITPGSKNDSFVNTDIPSNKGTPLPNTGSTRLNAPGSAAENADRAITELRGGGGGTRWVGENSTWVGRDGRVIAPHVKDIPKSTTAASQIQQAAPAQVSWRSGLIPRGSGYGRWQSADVVGKGMPSNPQIYSKATEAKILAERGTQTAQAAQAANVAQGAQAAQVANTAKAAEVAAKTGPFGGSFNASLANKANIVAAVATLAQMLGPKGKQGWTAANKEIGADMAGGVVDLEDLYT